MFVLNVCFFFPPQGHHYLLFLKGENKITSLTKVKVAKSNLYEVLFLKKNYLVYVDSLILLAL